MSILRTTRTGLLTVAVGIITLGACSRQSPSGATPTAIPRTATISEIKNIVRARTAGAEAFTDVTPGFVLSLGDQVMTGAESSARLDFSEGAIVRLAENTSLTVEALTTTDEGPFTRFQLTAGKLWIALFGGSLEVETPAGVASVRGSYAVVEYSPGDPADPADDVLVLDCIEGSCGAENDELGVDEKLGNLEHVELSGGGPEATPQVTRIVLTGDAVQEFIQTNPEVATAVVATLTAAPPPTDTPQPTPSATLRAGDTPAEVATESGPPAPTETPVAPADAPLPSATETPAVTGTLGPPQRLTGTPEVRLSETPPPRLTTTLEVRRTTTPAPLHTGTPALLRTITPTGKPTETPRATEIRLTATLIRLTGTPILPRLTETLSKPTETPRPTEPLRLTLTLVVRPTETPSKPTETPKPTETFVLRLTLPALPTDTPRPAEPAKPTSTPILRATETPKPTDTPAPRATEALRATDTPALRPTETSERRPTVTPAGRLPIFQTPVPSPTAGR